MTLWSLEIYGKIIIRLKAIKFSEDSFCYLSSIHFSLAIQAFMFPQSISPSVNNFFRPSFLGLLEFFNLFSNKLFY